MNKDELKKLYPNSGKMTMYGDCSPPERLERMRDDATFDKTAGFITLYRTCVEGGADIPDHWHQFAADLLYRAVQAVKTDREGCEKRGKLINVLGLRGSPSNANRNERICLAVQQYINIGSTQKEAIEIVSHITEGDDCPLRAVSADTIRRRIWGARDPESIESFAERMVGFDFLSQSSQAGLPLPSEEDILPPEKSIGFSPRTGKNLSLVTSNERFRQMKSTISTHKIERRLNARDVETVTGKHRQTIWRWEKKGSFPRSDYINGQKSWAESVILKWMDENIQSAEDREATRPEQLNHPPHDNAGHSAR